MLGVKKQMIEVNYSDLERAIAKHFGFKEYCIPAAEEVGNDTALTYRIDNEPLDTWEMTDLEEIKARGGNKNWRTQLLMHAMCLEGALEPGEYVINISW